MKKLLLIPLLGFLGLQAVENQYFSLEQKAQGWLESEATQQCLVQKELKAVLVDMLQTATRGGKYKNEHLQIEIVGTFVALIQLVHENIEWAAAQEYDCEQELATLYKTKASHGENSPEFKNCLMKLNHGIQSKSKYKTQEEADAASAKINKRATKEAADYILDQINKKSK